jgi:hypothetical protein
VAENSTAIGGEREFDINTCADPTFYKLNAACHKTQKHCLENLQKNVRITRKSYRVRGYARVGGSRPDGADSYPLLIAAAALEIHGRLFRIHVTDRRMPHH